MRIQSFSGTHPYSPHCLELAIDAEQVEPDDLVDELTAFIDRNVCPRCQVRTLEYPAGSRVTRCRCIPVCGPCGGEEALAQFGPECWPVTRADHDMWCRYTYGAVPQFGPAVLTTDSTGVPVVMSPQGVGEVKFREHPGGWAEFGFADDDHAA